MPKQDPMSVAVSQTLTADDYRRAFHAVKYCAYPRQRRSVRAGICLTVTALAASTVPVFRNFYGTILPPVLIAAGAAVLAVLIWFLQPSAESRRAGVIFGSCPLMAQPSQITLMRDCAAVQSEYEHYTEYWTDFSICVETPDLFAAVGGKQRDLLIVKKNGLDPERIAAVSECLSRAFALRYYKTKR